jgi:hypothetical protein
MEVVTAYMVAFACGVGADPVPRMEVDLLLASCAEEAYFHEDGLDLQTETAMDGYWWSHSSQSKGVHLHLPQTSLSEAAHFACQGPTHPQKDHAENESAEAGTDHHAVDLEG